MLNIKETGKIRGGLISGGGGGGGSLMTGCIFCLQVDGPIAEGRLGSGQAYKWQFTVFVLSMCI